MKYSEILRINRELGESMTAAPYKIIVLSNIVTNQLNEILEYTLRKDGINASVSSGEYDNIVQDSANSADFQAVIIKWELCNLIDGLQYKADTMTEAEISDLIEKVKGEIDFALKNLSSTGLILFNKFSTTLFNFQYLKKNQFDFICDTLNYYLAEKTRPGLVVLEIDRIIAGLSVAKSADFRYYYSSKSLYTTDFYKAYAAYIIPVFNSACGKTKKALIFDCDNTLWKGILGEDGPDKIEMSANTKSGVIFEEVQHLALKLTRQGVLLGICSKNNESEVHAVLDSHSEMTIRRKDTVISKINWLNKATNLSSIAHELNISEDTLVFVDDSDFEIGLVSESLPEVTSVQVPENLYEYPALIRSVDSLFYKISDSREDLAKTLMYQEQAVREDVRSSFNDVQSYLQSLGLELTIGVDQRPMISRISQLTQKTNQFNLTTQRYTENEILNFMKSEAHRVIDFNVKDKYGDSGLTGLCILIIDNSRKVAHIDSLLMSCRILGRNIEFAFFDVIIRNLLAEGILDLTAEYHKTYKNNQVGEYFDLIGLHCISNSEELKKYRLKTTDYTFKNIEYIKISHGTKN